MNQMVAHTRSKTTENYRAVTSKNACDRLVRRRAAHSQEVPATELLIGKIDPLWTDSRLWEVVR